MKPRILHAKDSKPFRPAGLNAALFGLASALQRAKKVNNLHAVPSILGPWRNLAWNIGKTRYLLFISQEQPKLQISLWNISDQEWTLWNKPLEEIFPWLRRARK